MNIKFRAAICLFVPFFISKTADSQDTLIKIKDYSVGYSNTKRLDIALIKCRPGNVFFIRVNSVEGSSSPADCKSGVVFPDMTAEDFRNRVKKLIIDHNVLNGEKNANLILANDMFDQRNFVYDLNNNVYEDIKEKLKIPPSKPAKSPKVKKKRKVSETPDGEDEGLTENEGDNEPGQDESISIPNISFFNAASFSFSGKLETNYLGLLNIFAPNIKHKYIVEPRWGFNTGIQKINYSNADSNGIQYYQDNVLLRPLDTIQNGTRYLRQFNKYTFATSNTIWSFYIQPLFRLSRWEPDDTKVGIYAHAHVELLIAKWSVTTSIERISQDTAVMAGTRGTIFSSLLPDKITTNQTFLNGYFGTGFTFYLDPFGNNNSRFFFQPTLGFTTNYPNPASVAIESNSASAIIASVKPSRLRSYEAAKSWNGFYLVKAKFIQALSSKSQIVVGTEMRGLLPRFAPQYAAFVGLNLDLNELSKLISGE